MKLEAIWIEISVHNKSLLLGGFYRPPNATNDYWTLVEESIDKAYNTKHQNIIITGDFNQNLLSQQRTKLHNLIDSYNLHQTINDYTNYWENSKTLLDVFMVNNRNSILTSFVADPFIPNVVRYHCPIVLVLKFSKPRSNSFQRHIWQYDRGNKQLYHDLLSTTDWDSILSNNCNENIASKITSTIFDAASKSIPNKIVTIRPDDLPWFTSKIRKMQRKRKRVHKKAKRQDTPQLWEKFKKIRNKVTQAIKQAQTDYEAKIIEKINNSSLSSKNWFKLAKTITKLDKSKQSIPPLIHGTQIASTNEEKANLLNEFFIKQSNITDSDKHPPNIPRVHHNTLSNIQILPQDIIDSLSIIDPSKASGPDTLSPRLLKDAAHILSTPLSIFFNKLISCGYMPLSWKKANVCPIFKKSDPSDPGNYRPVSLLSYLGKLMERCIHKYLYNFLMTNNVITSFQSGFIKGDSTTNQLLHIYNDFCKALDEGKEVRAVFCDISKAFDRVWHKGLLYKLSSIGIDGNLLSWFRSYLTDRQQRVVINNSCSTWQSIPAGVPQGSILGPLLFLIYINDIVNDIDAKIRLFADDTSLYVIVDDNQEQTSADIINSDLQKINHWASSWLVDFNPSKTESLIISRKVNKQAHPPLFMNNTQINEVSKHKHLGVTFDNDGKWRSHIDSITAKAWQRIGILRSMKFILNRKSLECLYFTFIRPLLEYSSSVWDNCSDEYSSKVEAIQVEAARIVTGATKLCSIDKLNNELKWAKLVDRRNHQKLNKMKK